MADESTITAPAADTSAPADGTTGELETQATSNQEALKKVETPKLNKRTLKLKVDGEEFDEEFDPNDEASLIRNLQLAKVSQKRMQDFSSLQKEVVQFIKELRENPKAVLKDPRIGLDVKKIAAEIIEEEIENSRKTPEQLELEKTRAEIKAMKDAQERDKASRQAEEFEKLKEQNFERYDIQMEQALAKSDLPKSPYLVKKMADYMLIALEGNKDITPEEVLPLVREEVMADLKSMFEVMPEDVVEKLIGKSKFDSIRKKNIVKAKQKVAVGSNRAPDVGKKSSDTKDDDKDKKTFKQFFGV